MTHSSHQSSFIRSLALTGLVLLPLFGYLFWHASLVPDTLSQATDAYPTIGVKVQENLSTLPTLPITEEKDAFKIEDSAKEGIDIQYANQAENQLQAPVPKQIISFPKDSKKPIEVKLDDERVITITDLSGKNGYSVDSLINSEATPPSDLDDGALKGWWKKLLGSLASKSGETPTFIRYTSDDGRKTLLYAYEKDSATGEKQLKHWTIYKEGTGLEEEHYTLENVKVKIADNGDAQVFYYGEKQIQNDAAAKEVEPSLLERAQKVLAQDLGDDILRSQTPDFTIPKPYYLDNQGERHDLEWQWSEEKKTLSVSINLASNTDHPASSLYPIALDPTLSFTTPGQSNTGSVITGESSSGFSTIMTVGDVNNDGKTDIIVGAYSYATSTGRAYLFYNDGSISTTAAAADLVITGETIVNSFGSAVVAGDFNTDGRTDLAVGASGWDNGTSNWGRTYIFYNDGSSFGTVSCTTGCLAANADVIISGEAAADLFGNTLVAGDFNTDGRTDLVVGAGGNNGFTGRTYIFYNDGSSLGTVACTTGCLAANADVIISGGAFVDLFGNALVAGDFNADGRTDLAVGANNYSSGSGRAYIFYNDGSIPTTAATADVTITGGATSNYFGAALAAGDFNADGRTDLAVGAHGYSTSTGRAYIFYNDGSIPTTAGTADITITGETTSNYFGLSLAAGDLNGDGKTDLVVGAYGYSSSTGRAYIFYNDGSIPTTAGTADVIISGEANSSYFGYTLMTGDINADGRTDLVGGAYNYASNTGRAYIFYSQNGQVNTNFSIAGNATSDQFGFALATGDVNSDGRTDLIIGANGYNPGAAANTGRAYIFYGDGQIPTTAATADVTITGNAASDEFGKALETGDFDADGDTDLAIGAPGYSTNTGRAYLFYNDGSIPTTAGTADVTITGEATGNYFGSSLTSGDLNSDGKKDLIVGAYGYSTTTGRAYIFYNDGSIPTTAATADVIITGETSSYFGISLTSGDFNADGTIDLVGGAIIYSSLAGRAYIFYNDGSIPTTAATADVIITGESGSIFGRSPVAGDFNADGRTDLAVSAYGYSTNTGRAYIFYNDGSIPTTAATADVIITGETTSNYFGYALAAGDMNGDGRTDLAVGAYGYTTNTGRTYIFYNDGSIPTTAATADVIITGETTSNYFGYALAAGDMNGDGRTDLAVGAYGNTSSTGKVYLYETRENFAWEIQRQAGSTPRTSLGGTGQELKITGEATTSGFGFGYALVTGDLNADGKPDLVMSSPGYSSNKGRVYVFYSDGSLTAEASQADIVITTTTTLLLGYSLAVADMNSDGQADLIVGAASGGAGSVRIFYNDGSLPTDAANADITINGENNNDLFGARMMTGDFNTDGRTDLVVGAEQYSSNTGRAYLFYNDGSSFGTTACTTGCLAANADVIISGEATGNNFSRLTAGDFNGDGRTDFAVGAYGYSTSTGRAYLFYNDGSSFGTVACTTGCLAANADVIISGESTNNRFGYDLSSGDFNADGKTDLAVGAYQYSSSTGRTYIFYNDGSIPTTAGTADVIISGESSSSFGFSLVSSDFNSDGRTDLAVGAMGYSTSTGRVYFFYNDGSIPTTAATADVTITGEATSSQFGYTLTASDFNADGRTDLAVGASGYSSSTGRVYIYTLGNDTVITGGATSDQFGYAMTSGDFNADGRTDLAVGAYSYNPGGAPDTGRTYIFYSDGSIPATAGTADVTISAQANTSKFGYALTAGDFNTDGRVDLAVGSSNYGSGVGRVYIFHNDGSIPTAAASADVILSGDAGGGYQFGSSIAGGDFNADGRIDLVIGASAYFNSTGRVYVFYNDGSYPAGASTADVTITGNAISDIFGFSLISGDWNADGRTDFAVGAYGYSSNTGRTYIFNNDGSIPTTAATADVIITGETTSNNFGYALTAGDFNADGKTDLAVGASGYSTNTGRAYIFYNDGSIPTTAATADVIITGETTSNSFAGSLVSGDFNSDGRTDLVVGAYGYSSNTGRAYIFYNDGSIPTTAATADVTLTGGATSNFFGRAFALGDFNVDGNIDLVVGAYGYSSSTGRVYVFASEAAASTQLPATTFFKGTGKLKGSGKLK